MIKYNLRFLNAIFCSLLIITAGKAIAMIEQECSQEARMEKRLKEIQKLKLRLNFSKISETNLNEVFEEHKFSYNGNFLFLKFSASINFDHCAQLFNLKTGINQNTYSCRELNTKAPKSFYRSCNFSYNDKFFWIKNNHGDTAELVDTETGKPLRKFKNTHYCVFTPDDRFLFVIHRYNGEVVEKVDTKTLKTVATYEDFSSCKFSHNGKFLFITNRFDKGVRLIDTETFREVKDLFDLYSDTRDIRNVKSCRFSHDDRFLFVCYDYNIAKLIDLTTKKPIKAFKNVYDYQFSNNDKYLFVKYNDPNQSAEIIDMETLNKIDKFKDVLRCKFSPNNRYLFIIHNDEERTAELFDQETGNKILKIFNNVVDCQFNGNSEFLCIEHSINKLDRNDKIKSYTIINTKKREIVVEDYPAKYLKMDKNFILIISNPNLLEIFKLYDEKKQFINNLNNLRTKANKENMKEAANPRNGFCDLTINTLE